MTTTAKKMTTRLSEIWRDWGMKQTSDEARTQQQALPALHAYLRTDSIALVRGMQALLVDPEQPGASKRPLFAGLWKAVQETWATAGTGGNDDLMYLQAMLLAAWPDDIGNVLPPALLSPWIHGVGRHGQTTELLQWREVRAAETLIVSSESEQSEELNTSALEELNTSLAELPWAMIEPSKTTTSTHIYNQTIHYILPGVIPPLQQILVGLQGAVGNLAEWSRQSIQDLMTNLATSQEPEGARLQELLWWGQARYCHLAKTPYRRIDDPARALWLAAREAAERAHDVPVEPGASYLQEMLAALGHSLGERRPLRAWLADLRPALQREPRPTPPAALKKAIERDAYGIPVTLLCTSPAVADDILHNNLGVPGDVVLDRGEWAAWVFRELVFQLRWEAA